MPTTNTTNTTTPAFTYESDFVRELVGMDNAYPDCKRDQRIRNVYGTGARLQCVNGEYQIHVSI